MHVSEPKLTKRSRPTESTGHTQRHTLGTINNRRNTHQAMIKVDIIRKRKRITRQPMNRLGHRGSCNKTLDEQAEIHVAKQMKQKKNTCRMDHTQRPTQAAYRKEKIITNRPNVNTKKLCPSYSSQHNQHNTQRRSRNSPDPTPASGAAGMRPPSAQEQSAVGV